MYTPSKNIHYPISVDKGLGKLAEESDYDDHIKDLMMQVLLTNPGERINRPDFGCGIKQMIFAPNSQITADLAKITILQALDEWLGSVIDTNEVVNLIDDEAALLEIKQKAAAKLTPEERKVLGLE